MHSTGGDLTLNNLTLKEGDGGNAPLISVFGDFTMSNSALVESTTADAVALIGLGQATTGKTTRISNSTIVPPLDPDVSAISVATNQIGDVYLDHVTIISPGYIGLNISSTAAAKKVHLRNSLLGGTGGSEGWWLCYILGGGTLGSTQGSFVRDLTCGVCTGGNPMPGSFTGSPGYYPLRSDSPAKDIGDASICAAYPKDQAGEDRPATNCNAGAVEAEYDLPPNSTPAEARMCEPTSAARSNGGFRRVSRVSKAWTPTPTREPFSTCADFRGPRIIVRGYNVGTQCQEVGALGIGNAQIIAEGFIYALDVWSYLAAGVQVCFDKPGKAIVMDAATAPRQILPLDTYLQDGHTCVDLYRPGTIILQPGPWPPSDAPGVSEEGWALSGCMAGLERLLEPARDAWRGGEARAASGHLVDGFEAHRGLDLCRPSWRLWLGQRQLGDA